MRCYLDDRGVGDPLLLLHGGLETVDMLPALTAALADRYRVIRTAAEAIGRDPGDLRYSVATTTVVGSDRADVERRYRASHGDPAEIGTHGGMTVGTPAEVIDRIGALAENGVQRVYFQVFDLRDLDHLELIGTEVLPHLP